MFKFVKVFEDPTKGFINTRFIQHLMFLADYTELTEGERKEFFDLLILIGKKLSSVWLHLQSFNEEQQTLVLKAKEKPISPADKVYMLEPSQTLFFEFDEFLVQVKSSLDYLVKIPAIVIGRKTWTLRTFGNKGEDVIKKLRNNLPNEYKARAEAAITFIEKNQPWLEDTITARDKINHFIDGGINFEYFTVAYVKHDDTEQVVLPKWSPNQTIADFMDVIWKNLYRLCEDLVGCFLYMRIKKEYAFYHGESDVESIQSPWKVTSYEEYRRVTSMQGWKDASKTKK